MTGPLDALVGTWRGEGEGEFPTIQPFMYSEEVVIGAVAGKPRLSYVARTKGTDGEPLHSESGFLRWTAAGDVELVVAHGFGVTEIAEGGFDEAGVLRLASTGMVGSSSAKEVTATTRTYRIDGDTLAYEIAMAAVGVPLTHHLRATLHRA